MCSSCKLNPTDRITLTDISESFRLTEKFLRQIAQPKPTAFQPCPVLPSPLLLWAARVCTKAEKIYSKIRNIRIFEIRIFDRLGQIHVRIFSNIRNIRNIRKYSNIRIFSNIQIFFFKNFKIIFFKSGKKRKKMFFLSYFHQNIRIFEYSNIRIFENIRIFGNIRNIRIFENIRICSNFSFWYWTIFESGENLRVFSFNKYCKGKSSFDFDYQLEYSELKLVFMLLSESSEDKL